MAFRLPINSINTAISGETFLPGGVVKSITDGYLAGSTSLFESNGNVGVGTSVPVRSLDIRGTDSLVIPVGSTGQRPANLAGQIRFNSTTGSFEGNNGNVWAELGGSGGGISIVTVSNSYVMDSTEDLVIANASAEITITLPDASTVKSYDFQNSGSGSVVLETINSQQINGASNLVIQFTNSSCRLTATGSTFLIF